MIREILEACWGCSFNLILQSSGLKNSAVVNCSVSNPWRGTWSLTATTNFLKLTVFKMFLKYAESKSPDQPIDVLLHECTQNSWN